MSDMNSDSPQYSAAAERHTEEQIRSSLRSAPDVSPDIARLIRSLCGDLSSVETHLVERSLTTDASLRQQYLNLYTELEALQLATWAEVVARAETGDPAAQAWRKVVIERAEAAGRASADTGSRMWTALQHAVTAGVAEAQATWTAFAAFREQLRLSLQFANSQPAPARGSTDWSDVRSVGLPPGIESRLQWETKTDGSLQVSLLLNDAHGQPFLTASGLVALLELELEGDVWPLAECTLAQNRGEWTVPLFDREFASLALQLQPDVFRVVIGDTAPLLQSSTRRLFVTVQDAEGRSISDRPIRLIIEGNAHIEKGLLSVTLSLPAAVRERYRDYLLVLDAGIIAEHWQRLMTWPVKDWGREARTLTIPCPDLADTEAFAVPLRVGLRSLD